MAGNIPTEREDEYPQMTSYKGAFESIQAVRIKYSNGRAGWFAFVYDTESFVYWNVELKNWKNIISSTSKPPVPLLSVTTMPDERGTGVGDKWYNPINKQIYTTTQGDGDNFFDMEHGVTPESVIFYLCDHSIYLWENSDLVNYDGPSINTQVPNTFTIVHLKSVTTMPDERGTGVGNKWYNPINKQIYTTTQGDGDNFFDMEHGVTPESGIFYLCDHSIYLWENSDLVNYDGPTVVNYIPYTTTDDPSLNPANILVIGKSQWIKAGITYTWSGLWVEL